MSTEAAKARHRLAWGLGAQGYMRYALPELAPVAERLLEIADPAWGAAVLDVGTGPGTAALVAARLVGPPGRVVGVDLAPEMAALAERNARAAAVTHATFLVGDAEDLSELENGSFDVVVSNFGLIFAPEPARAVSEAARVLRPGGVLAMSHWVLEGMVAETFRFMATILPPPPPGISRPEDWGEPGAAEARLGSTFQALERTPIVVPCAYSSVDAAWQRVREGQPPFALAYGKMGAEERVAVEARVREFYRQRADLDGRVHFDRSAAIVRGVKK